jgi:hypothetical protein
MDQNSRGVANSVNSDRSGSPVAMSDRSDRSFEQVGDGQIADQRSVSNLFQSLLNEEPIDPINWDDDAGPVIANQNGNQNHNGSINGSSHGLHTQNGAGYTGPSNANGPYYNRRAPSFGGSSCNSVRGSFTRGSGHVGRYGSGTPSGRYGSNPNIIIGDKTRNSDLDDSIHT